MRQRLFAAADAWPADELRAPPATDGDALDLHGVWSAEACGVAIRPCEDRPSKGLGAFAIHPIARGRVAGVYAGELLTAAEYRARHEVRRCWRTDAERVRRLSSLPPGRAPMGGADNGGAYVVCLVGSPELVGWASRDDPSAPLYIDGEDDERSSWCRFINHVGSAEAACNLQLCVAAAPRPLAWLVATRDIAVGEELAFDYGPRYGLPRSDVLKALTCSVCGVACVLGVECV